MKTITILGSTGSIGCNTLEIIEKFPDQFKVAALCAGKNASLLAAQAQKHRPALVAVLDEETKDRLKALLPKNNSPAVVWGEEGYREAASMHGADMTVSAMVGGAGLLPTLAAIESGKDIALANKETLVMAGEIVMQKAEQKGVSIYPVDSEHSAIFQSIRGQQREDLDKIILTASGGPFRTLPKERFPEITLEKALDHPNWKMGKKITIDSATLMNKGLEVIEASYLFDMPPNRIDVVVHPQSIIHSMAVFKDGSVIAQMGVPDMKGAIAYALSCPKRLPTGVPPPDFAQIASLTFETPDMEKFPCLALAFEALMKGGVAPSVLNAANEIAVDAFLEGKIHFTRIPELVKQGLDTYHNMENPTLNDILLADAETRKLCSPE